VDAAHAWHQVVKTDPENAAAWFNLGYCLHAAGNLDEAIEVHKKAAGFDEFRGIATYNLACAYALTGKTDAAFEALATAQATGFRLRGQIESDPDLDSLRGDPRYDALLSREPAGFSAFLQQAVMGIRQFVNEHAPDAEQQIGGMLQQFAQQAQGILAELAQDERFAGIAQKIQGWLGGAMGQGRRPAMEMGDNPPATGQAAPPAALQAIVAQARRHQEAGEWPQAIKTYEAIIDHAPESRQAWFGLAYCVHMSGDYERAIKVHKKAATFDEIKGISLYNLACAYALTGRTDDAIDALEASAKAGGFDLADPMRDDTDLDSVRDDPRYQHLLRALEGGEL